ncbi:OLC1v1012263C1 [Oldenlandia corymbosa var. corymbosa]|uniref:OLC1v1012263C1 n=1 Tax=Oldenlandia corymbosa var. corymbosa TaxID=529605 RepID=A0AAV1DW76_OLDCO|nr:OLC1v1012263C1 [Oldenlandia corymbosa var. corymbosa]
MADTKPFESAASSSADHRRFNEIKKRWGFPKLLRLLEFEDPRNGYLFHDECVFGVEVSVCQYSGRAEGVGRPEKQISNSSTIYSWKVTGYSTLPKSGVYKSPEFSLENHKWSIDFYPRGNHSEEGKSISVYLHLHNDYSESKV